VGFKEKFGLKEGFSLWGAHKISWRSTGVQNLVFHPAMTSIMIGPLIAFWSVGWWLWPAAAWAGIVNGKYHEWTQFISRDKPHVCPECGHVHGGRNPNLLERGLDILGHVAIPALVVGLLELFGVL
jgi:hypothetical protein